MNSNAAMYKNKFFTLAMGNLQLSFPTNNMPVSTRRILKTPLHSHFFYEIFFILDGGCTLKTNSKTFSVKKDDICIIPPNITHQTISRSENAEAVVLGIFPRRLKTALNTEHNAEYEYFSHLLSSLTQPLIVQSSASDYIHKLSAASDKDGVYYGHKKEALLTLIFLELTHDIEALHLSDKKNINSKELVSSDEAIIRKFQIENFILENFNKSVSIDELAHILHLSIRQTSRSLQALTGCSFKELIMQHRMKAAESLIYSSDTSLNDISLTVGYTSYKGFHDAFKKYFGISPNDMRSQKQSD